MNLKHAPVRAGIAALALLASTSCFALEQYSAIDASLIEEEAVKKPEPRDFLVEANLQINSITSSGNTMFGPGLLWTFVPGSSVGFRTMLSTGRSRSYSASLLYRLELGQGATRAYLEPGASLHLIDRSRRYLSGGLALGLMHDIARDLAIGGSVGVEVFRDGHGTSDAVTVMSADVAPRASLQLSVFF